MICFLPPSLLSSVLDGFIARQSDEIYSIAVRSSLEKKRFECSFGSLYSVVNPRLVQ